MVTTPKIKIDDCAALRQELDALYESASQITLAKWALLMSKHSLAMATYEHPDDPVLLAGYATNEAWQNGNASIHAVRQAGFKIHALAKACENETWKTALRVAGQAVGTGHMREHAMVASDYAVKVVNLLHPGQSEAVTQERQWQLDCLKAQIAFPARCAHTPFLVYCHSSHEAHRNGKGDLFICNITPSCQKRK